MFAVTGITGKVGGETARRLLEAKLSVRAVMRDDRKRADWAARGCEVAIADMSDAKALAAAFSGVVGVFVLVPPIFDPAPGFPEVKGVLAALKMALLETNPEKVVVISTIGAQATEPNLLSQLGMMEQEFRSLPMPVTFLRPAWFFENAAQDVEPARATGKMHSFLQPLDKPVPMVSTEDIGRVAAGLLQESWTGHRVVELEGPRRVTPMMVAATLALLLGRAVQAAAVPREAWEEMFRGQGMKNPEPRMRMLDGFNEGWIEFEGGQVGALKGHVDLEAALKMVV
jgi:NAD(P)H dehydrogenase (quinone)